jgi:hypothetical protein
MRRIHSIALLLCLAGLWGNGIASAQQIVHAIQHRINQVGTNIRFAFLSTSSNGLFVVYNTRAVTMDYVDPHNQERITLSRALLVKFTYLLDF